MKLFDVLSFPVIKKNYQAVLKEAGNRLGLDIEVIEVSAERSLNLVASGAADAECCRISKVIKQNYPTLIDVPPSFYEMHWVAFVKKQDISIKAWEDLDEYSAAAVTGYKLAVNKVNEFSQTAYILDSHESMFEMIMRDRVDVGISSKEAGAKVIKDMRLNDSINIIDPPLVSIPLTFQLNPKHEDKKEKFSKVFKEMNEDGTTKRILDEIMKEL